MQFLIAAAAAAAPTPVDTGGVAWYDWDNIKEQIVTWAPILFMGLLVFFLWRTTKLMPRTKPLEIKPESKWAISWDDVAGAGEAKGELQEVGGVLCGPKGFARPGATAPRGITPPG